MSVTVTRGRAASLGGRNGAVVMFGPASGRVPAATKECGEQSTQWHDDSTATFGITRFGAQWTAGRPLPSRCITGECHCACDAPVLHGGWTPIGSLMRRVWVARSGPDLGSAAVRLLAHSRPLPRARAPLLPSPAVGHVSCQRRIQHQQGAPPPPLPSAF